MQDVILSKSAAELGAMDIWMQLQEYHSQFASLPKRSAELTAKQNKWMKKAWSDSIEGGKRLPDGWKMTGTAAPADDDDDMVVRQKSKVHCPITKKLFVEPVISPPPAGCGHVFERQAIHDLCAQSAGRGKSKQSVTCPESGCGKMVHLSDLVPHLDSKTAVKQHQRAAKSRPTQDAEDMTDALEL